MEFHVLKSREWIPHWGIGKAFLRIDNWNDFGFLTLFSLVYVGKGEQEHEIGSVKIACSGQQTNESKLEAGLKFNALGEIFFSVGQDESYYENLNKLGSDLRDEILAALRDIAKSPEAYKVAIVETITTVSLFREVSPKTVTGQFRRLANGGFKLTPFNFQYHGSPSSARSLSNMMTFSVVPESNPPTNIHVLIGRNGEGKTRLISNMITCLYDGDNVRKDQGNFNKEAGELFPNLILISFSAFENTIPFPVVSGIYDDIKPKYHYIGLRKIEQDGRTSDTIKTTVEITREFVASLEACIRHSKAAKWIDAIGILESDPNFYEANVRTLLATNLAHEDSNRFKIVASELFQTFSSGHKVILLTITRLIEKIQEKTLVFIDEPEAHLHPPLLSAFTRALSELLVNTNGVAIIATHSPVILQEVPRSCVWKIRRVGKTAIAERLEIESFGENVGILTREIFGLEVTESGFYKVIAEALDNANDYDDLLALFKNQLGFEARSIVRTLLANKNSRQ